MQIEGTVHTFDYSSQFSVFALYAAHTGLTSNKALITMMLSRIKNGLLRAWIVSRCTSHCDGNKIDNSLCIHSLLTWCAWFRFLGLRLDRNVN